MNKSIILHGHYALLVVFIWDTFNYNIPHRIDTFYEYLTYLREYNYAYTFAVLIIASLYLILIKLQIKFTIEIAFL